MFDDYFATCKSRMSAREMEPRSLLTHEFPLPHALIPDPKKKKKTSSPEFESNPTWPASLRHHGSSPTGANE